MLLLEWHELVLGEYDELLLASCRFFHEDIDRIIGVFSYILDSMPFFGFAFIFVLFVEYSVIVFLWLCFLNNTFSESC